MSTLTKWAAVIGLAATLAGCAGTSTASRPCASCTNRVVLEGKHYEVHSVCAVNGKEVDCTKSPAECPMCVKK